MYRSACSFPLLLHHGLRVGGALACVLGLVAVAPAQQRAAPPPALVQLAEVVSRPVTPVAWVPGAVVSRDDANIAAEVEGRLQQVAEVGDRLQAGAAVATIDPTRLRLQVAEAGAQVQELEPLLRFQQREAERLSRLADDNNAARNQLEQTLARRDELQGRLRAAKARLALAEDDFAKVRLTVPFPAVVVERIRHPGEQVKVGDEVARVVDTDTREVKARLSAAGLANLRVGDTLRMQAAGKDYSGRVRAVVPVGDVSRLYEVRVTLEEDAGALPVGMPMRVAVPNAYTRDALLVPRDALVIRSFGISVFRVNGEGMAEQVPVLPGYAEGEWVEVRGELNAGERVVVRGNERLRPGQPVREQGAENASGKT